MNPLIYKNLEKDLIEGLKELIDKFNFKIIKQESWGIWIKNKKALLEIYMEDTSLQFYITFLKENKKIFICDFFNSNGLKEEYMKCINYNLNFTERNKFFITCISGLLTKFFKDDFLEENI